MKACVVFLMIKLLKHLWCHECYVCHPISPCPLWSFVSDEGFRHVQKSFELSALACSYVHVQFELDDSHFQTKIKTSCDYFKFIDVCPLCSNFCTIRNYRFLCVYYLNKFIIIKYHRINKSYVVHKHLFYFLNFG